MSRPENVRCETCVFWAPCDGNATPHGNNPKFLGLCHLDPVTELKLPGDFCSNCRDTWPPNRDLVYLPTPQMNLIEE